MAAVVTVAYTPSLDTPGVVLTNLAAIDHDLAQRLNDYETASRKVAQAKRDYERSYALEYVRTVGSVETRKQQALAAVWLIDDGVFMQDYQAAEAELDALKAVLRVLEARASINQSCLKHQVRETFGRAA